jgi:hypothetical protein
VRAQRSLEKRVHRLLILLILLIVELDVDACMGRAVFPNPRPGSVWRLVSEDSTATLKKLNAAQAPRPGAKLWGPTQLTRPCLPGMVTAGQQGPPAEQTTPSGSSAPAGEGAVGRASSQVVV